MNSRYVFLSTLVISLSFVLVGCENPANQPSGEIPDDIAESIHIPSMNSDLACVCTCYYQEGEGYLYHPQGGKLWAIPAKVEDDCSLISKGKNVVCSGYLQEGSGNYVNGVFDVCQKQALNR